MLLDGRGIAGVDGFAYLFERMRIVVQEKTDYFAQQFRIATDAG